MPNWKSSWILKLTFITGVLFLTFISGLYVVYYSYYPYGFSAYGFGFPLAWFERYYSRSYTLYYRFVELGFLIDFLLYSLFIAVVSYFGSRFLRSTLAGRRLFLIKDKARASRVLSVIACLLLLSSLFLPFFFAETGGIIEEESYTTWFWSFKAYSQQFYFSRLLGTTWVWFFHYWNGNYFVAEETPSLLSTLPIIFILHILTLAVATASIFAKRLMLFCTPMSLSIIILMILYGSAFVPHFEQFLAGFWIMVASFILFLALTILNCKWKCE
jgi:hypothetical protein